MLFLLIIFLLIMLIYAYFRQKSIVSPFFLVVLALFLSSMIILFNYENWMVDIEPLFLFCIITAVFSWLFGSFAFNHTFGKHCVKRIKVFKYPKRFVDNYPYKLMLLLCLILTAIFIRKILSGIDLSSGFNNILREIYNQKVTSSSGNFLIHQVDKIIITIGYISFLQILLVAYSSRKVRKKKQKIILLLLSILLSFVTMVIATDRNVFIRFAIYCICLWVFFSQNKYKLKGYGSRRYNLNKINVYSSAAIGVVVVALVLVFFVMGKAKNYTSNLTRMVGIYAGSGMYNFNLYLKQGVTEFTSGASTFKAFNGVLSTFGLDLFKQVEELPLLVQVSSNGYIYASNIYSALQPFYTDFGILGIAIFTWTMGFFFEILYYFARRNGVRSKLVYSAFIYPAIYFPIADQFYARMHLGLLYEVFWLAVFVLIVYKRKCYRKIQKIKETNVSNYDCCLY